MNEKRGNIDNWLKTAAQQPGPGLDRKDEEEGWAGLSAMLDDDKKRPGIIAGGTGIVSGLRRKRWLIFTAAALIVSLTLLMSSLYFSKDATDITRPSSTNALTSATPGNTNNTVRNGSDSGMTQQAPTPPSGITQHEEPAEQVAGAVVGHEPTLPLASETAGEVTLQHQQQALTQQKAAAPPAQKEPDELENIKANGLSLQTLPLPHSYGLSLSGAGQHLLTTPSSKAATARYPRWAIQAGFLATNDKGRGARVSLMYHLPIKGNFYLQPYIGAGYTGNYNKALMHFGVQSVVDGSGLNRTDSIWTTYRVKSVLNADAGIRIGYTLRQFSFGTGVRYHHILHSTGDSSALQKWGGAPTGVMYNQAFSKADAPGKHSFYGEIEANYQWRFGLTTGISYQFLINESSSPAWQSPAMYSSGGSNSTTLPGGLINTPNIKNSLQDKGRLEIYLRLPLRRK